MLHIVRQVRDEVLRRCGEGRIDLEVISAVFRDITRIDRIDFVAYDTDPANPLCGRFRCWQRQPVPYAPLETVAEIAYASHLDENWRRFVVCKELCHALDKPNGSHRVTEGQMDALVEALALASASGDKSHLMSVPSELLAEYGAVEILFPLQQRAHLVVSDGPPSEALTMQAAAQWRLPAQYAQLGLFGPYNQMIRTVVEV